MKVAAIKINGVIKLSYTDVEQAKLQANKIKQSIERIKGDESIELGWIELSETEYQKTRASIEVGDTVSLFTPRNYYDCHHVEVRIERETEKAIMVKNLKTKRTCWFPKSVLETDISICIEGVYRQLTPIKRMSDEQWKVLQERVN